MKPFSEQNYYELLDLTPQAGAAEIEAAHARAQELFAEDSIAIYSLDPEQAAALRQRVTEAYEYLSDPELRGEYDHSIGVVAPPPLPPPLPPRVVPVEVSPPRPSAEAVQLSLGEEFSRSEPQPPPLPSLRIPSAELLSAAAETGPVQAVRVAPVRRAPEISPEAEVNGELLRQVREARGMSLALLAERTKISARHLENVEADRYDALPATVYLRGILMNVARELGLDALRVSKSYLALIK